MRRSICYCEPSQAFAGEIYTWKFIYTTANDLPKGTIIRFDLMSDGRNIDWEIPEANPKKSGNVIYGSLDNGKVVPAKEIEIEESYVPQFEFQLPSEIETGSNFTIIVGSSKLTDKLLDKNGTQAQTYHQRRRPFHLYIDTTGKGRFSDPEVFSIDVKGNELHHISVLTPSFVSRNKRFDITVRFEDEFGNLTSQAPEDTLIELSYEQLRENLNWKLFVPETGFITLPNLYFNEAGIYTILMKNLATGEVFKSSPIKCFETDEQSIYWGLLHGESVKVDSTENIENCLRHFRDEKAINFFSTSSFESQEETPNDIWKLICQNVNDFDENERFTTLLGLQWSGSAKSEGIRHFVFAKDNKQPIRKKDPKFSSLKKIYKASSPKDFISIPCFTMGAGMEYNFNDFNPEFERVVEIYNSWGSSEMTAKQGNSRPIKGPAKVGVQETADGSVLNALLQNKRFGFVAGGLDDRGVYADFFESDQEQYSPGMTAIVASEHSRAALYDALYNRSCYATTGPQIIVGIDIAGLKMGQETTNHEKPGFELNRHIAGFVAGTTKIEKIEIVRNGDTIHTIKPGSYHIDFSYDDMTALKDVVHDARDKNPPFIFYYLRVTQEDGEMAWSSPIWIDALPGKPPQKKVKTPPKTSKKKIEDFAEFDDDDDDDDGE